MSGLRVRRVKLARLVLLDRKVLLARQALLGLLVFKAQQALLVRRVRLVRILLFLALPVQLALLVRRVQLDLRVLQVPHQPLPDPQGPQAQLGLQAQRVLRVPLLPFLVQLDQ